MATVAEARAVVDAAKDGTTVPVEHARALMAHADSLQAGLDGAHGRLAELEAKLDSTTGYETAERLRAARLQKSDSPADLSKALDRAGKILDAVKSVARRVNANAHRAVIDAMHEVSNASKALANQPGGAR